MNPENCQSIGEVRAGMDALDREIIALIAKRVEYVRAAARFKPSAEAVVDRERMETVFVTRRGWAEEAGLDGPAIEAIYRALVAYCVSEEHRYWNNLSAK